MVEPAKEKEFLRKKFRVEEVLKKKFKMSDGGLLEVQENNMFPVFNQVLQSPSTNHVSSPLNLAASFTRPSRGGVSTTFPLPQLQPLNQTSVPQIAAKLRHSQPQHSYFHHQLQTFTKSSQQQQQQQQQHQQHLQHHRQQQQLPQIQLPQIHHLQQLKQQQQLLQQQKHQQEEHKLLSQSPHHVLSSVSLPSHHHQQQQHQQHQQQQQQQQPQQQQQKQPMFRVYSPLQEPGEILLPPLQPVNQKHLLSSSVQENTPMSHQDQQQLCQDGQKKAIPQPNSEPQSKETEKDHKSTQVQSHVSTTVGYQKVEKICPMRFIDLLKNLSHVEGTIAWCMDLGLIPSSHTCHRCGAVMQLKPCPASVTSDGYIWQCNKLKSGVKCDTSRSLRAGSWFSHSNLTLEEVLQITYWWTQLVSEDFLVYQTAVSKPSVLDWCNYCQELCLTYLMKQSQSIGGPGTVVEIDEAMFYGRNGHRLSGQWIFSGIQQNSNWSCFIFPIGEKTDGTGLIEIIERWVKPGTTVLCNWNPTDRLTDDGYTYLKFTHNMTFKSVEDMEVNDTSIINENGDLSLKDDDDPVIAKNFWKEIRASSISTESVNGETIPFDSSMAESIWRKQQGEEDIFLSFIKAVKFAYS